MMFSYSSRNGVVEMQRDLVREACEAAQTDSITEAISKFGYTRAFEIGNPEVAAIELFNNSGAGDYAALIQLTLGNEIQMYAINNFHDALEFMKEYVPTIKAMTALAEKKFD